MRTSWVIGDGPNFVRTMARLADEGVAPAVVDDQVGRLTFADEIARATRHLLDADAPYGTYHVSNGGPAMSWADVAREVFALRGRDPGDVARVTHRGVRRRAAVGAAAAAQRAVDRSDRGDRLRAGRRAGGAARLLPRASAVVVVEPDDVVLAEVVAALHLDHDQALVVLVGDPVRRADGDVERAARRDLVRLTVDQAGGGARTTVQCSARWAWVW